MLAGISATVNAAQNRRLVWLTGLLLLTVLGVIAVIYWWLNPSSTNTFSHGSFPPPVLDFTPWVPIVILLATMIYSLWPTPPIRPKPVEPPAGLSA